MFPISAGARHRSGAACLRSSSAPQGTISRTTLPPSSRNRIRAAPAASTLSANRSRPAHTAAVDQAADFVALLIEEDHAGRPAAPRYDDALADRRVGLPLPVRDDEAHAPVAFDDVDAAPAVMATTQA
jgi:hypothetical protein